MSWVGPSVITKISHVSLRVYKSDSTSPHVPMTNANPPEQVIYQTSKLKKKLLSRMKILHRECDSQPI